jgi:hypothetical protein
MRNHFFRMFLILALFLFTGSALAGYDEPMLESSGNNVPRNGMLSNGVDTVHFLRSCLCPDIAITPPFRSAGLDYVHSVEFAESVYAVASGTSRYSPEVLPAEWMATAYSWWTHVAVKEIATIKIFSATETLRSTGKAGPTIAGLHEIRLMSPTGRGIDLEQAGLTGESCHPSLLFRASLEYRWRTGNPDAKLLYPHKVRMATRSLEDSIRAKMQVAKRFAERADRITDMISMAEQKGAATCQPRELALAKSELARARHLVTDIHHDIQETESSFAKAEVSAGSILSMQRFASSRGFMCYSR